MSDLLDKLNVLLRSSVNSFLSGQPESAVPRSGPVAANRLGKDIDAEIAGLRKQVETALAQEDAMQARLEKYQQKIDAYDRQADAALSQKDDANARALLQQMERQKQQAAMLKAELEQHRQATSEFIEHVNTLDAIRSDALRQKQEAQAATPAGADSTTIDTESSTERAPVLSDLLRNVRERVNDVVTPRSGPATAPDQVEPPQEVSKNSIKIAIGGSKAGPTSDSGKPENKAEAKPDAKPPAEDDDLAKRRARLSKPD